MSRDPDGASLRQSLIRLNRSVLALTLGFLGGSGLLLATLWLVIKGGPHVGAHLGLLSQFFYGYTVTFRGSLIGFLYGFVIGHVAGWIIATVYNWIVSLKTR